jgi:hypothetical protein
MMIQEFSNSQILQFQNSWKAANPFPNIVFDNFLENASLHSKEFPESDWPHWFSLGDEYQKNKYSCSKVNVMPKNLKDLFAELSNPRFLQTLEKITSIIGLIPDPYLEGGGLHLSLGGGVLALHTDFHIYQKLGLYRRLNLILYLNENWKQGDGGELELTLAGAEHSPNYCIEPLLNRAVLFQTDDKSIHGFSSPVRHETTRKSIAVYYYTSYETNFFSGDQTTHWRTHGSLSTTKSLRLMMYKLLLKVSRLFSLTASIVNPNQGVSLLRSRLRQRK